MWYIILLLFLIGYIGIGALQYLNGKGGNSFLDALLLMILWPVWDTNDDIVIGEDK